MALHAVDRLNQMMVDDTVPRRLDAKMGRDPLFPPCSPLYPPFSLFFFPFGSILDSPLSRHTASAQLYVSPSPPSNGIVRARVVCERSL